MNHRSLLRAATVCLTLAAVAFLLALAWRHRVVLQETLLRADLVWLLVGLTVLLVTNVCAAGIFVVLARNEGAAQVPASRMAGVFLISQVGKYLPGRVWSVILQGGMIENGPSPVALAIANVELILILLACCLGVGLAAFAGVNVGIALAGTLLALIIAGVYAMITARITRRIVVTVMRLVGRESTMPDAHAQFSVVPSDRWLQGLSSCGLVLSYFSGWFILVSYGLGFGPSQGALLVAMLSLSWIAGVLSLLPGGLGVREAALVGFAGFGYFDSSILASVALATRMCLLVLDMASLPLGIVLFRFNKKE